MGRAAAGGLTWEGLPWGGLPWGGLPWGGLRTEPLSLAALARWPVQPPCDPCPVKTTWSNLCMQPSMWPMTPRPPRTLLASHFTQVLLKTALLFGVRLHVGSELVAVQAPTTPHSVGGRWKAWARSPKFAAAQEDDEDDEEEDDEEEEEEGEDTSSTSELALAGAPMAEPPRSNRSNGGKGRTKKLAISSMFANSDRAHADGSAAASSQRSKKKKSPKNGSSKRDKSTASAVAAGATQPAGVAAVAAPQVPAAAISKYSQPKLDASALDFKPTKIGDYSRTLLQGANNMLATSEVSKEFVLGPMAVAPSDVRLVQFDALALAEGEWSPTCKRLGVTKTVDRFATAIGLVVNLELDPECKVWLALA